MAVKKLIAIALLLSTPALADVQTVQLPPGLCNSPAGTTSYTFAEYTGYFINTTESGAVITYHRCFDNAAACNVARNSLGGNAGVAFGQNLGAAAAATLSVGRINGVCYEEAN